MTGRTRLCLLAALAVLIDPVGAEEPKGRMGLRDAEQIALDSSMDLRLLQVEAAALEKNRGQKFRDFFPQASVSYRQNRTVAQRDFDNGNHSVQMQLSQPIYDGGKSQISLEIADIDLRLLTEKKKQTINQLRLQARQQYLKLQQALISVSVAKADLDSSKALLRKSEAEQRLGSITALDLAEIRNQYKQRELALRKEENGYTDALKDFGLFLRLPENDIPQIKVLDLSSLTVSPLNASKDDMVRTARENRPDLRQARIDRLKSEMQYRITERYYLPTVSLTGHYGKTGDKWPPRTLEWGVGINVSFPIYGSSVKTDSSVNHSKNESQRSISTGGSVDLYDNAAWQEPKLRSAMEVMRTKDKQEVLSRQVELTIERLIRDYDDRRRSLELADETLAVRDRRFQIELKKYESGETSLTDLFTEEVKLISARQALIKERVDFALSVNQLELELGLDLDELGLISFTEHDTDSAEVIKRSWTPRTKIEIPKLRFDEGR